jgi:hypothetical protein
MPVSIGPTLSRNNQQPVFLAQGNGVIYIKIARKDNQGNDNTLSLQELNNIRLKFSDAGIVDYPIANITEYPDYYLYQIFRTNITSSADDNIRNYRFSASALLSPFSQLVSGDSSVDIDSYTSEPFDYLNYFNTSSGIYTFGDTPNVKIIYTASILVSTGGTRTVGFSLTPPTGSAIASTSTNVNGTATLTIQGTASFLENTQLLLRFANDSAPGQDATISNIQWQFTQSFAPNSSSNLTILEPYLESEFEYSDCNVLLNNADQNQIGSFFRRVLYDDGSIIPSNFQEILSQSAEYAEVKDYNYTARAQIYPRYNGVKTTSPDFNLRTINISTYEGTRLDSIATGDPNAQILTDKFAVFDWMGGADPEIRTGGAGIHLTQLINPDGTIIGLTPENKNLFAVEQIFKPGSSASVYFLTTTNTNVPNFQTSIYDAGAYYNSLMAVSGTFDLFLYPPFSNIALPQTSTTSPYFILSGSTQISSVITASYGNTTFTRLFISNNQKPPGLGIGKFFISESGMINSEDSLFPTQQYDIIRFYPTSSIDTYYALQGTSGSNEVIQRVIMSQSVDGNNFYFYLDSPISASQFPSASNDQGFRIYRRIPNETFVYINDYQAGSGLLIPGNYDPNLDYLQIARRAGLL